MISRLPGCDSDGRSFMMNPMHVLSSVETTSVYGHWMGKIMINLGPDGENDSDELLNWDVKVPKSETKLVPAGL